MLGEFEGVQGWEESSVFHQDLLSPLGMRAESEERPQQVACCRAGDEAGGLDMQRERPEAHYLLSWPSCFPGGLSWWFLENVCWN